MLLDHRQVLEVALDASGEVVRVGLDDAERLLLTTASPRSPHTGFAAAEALGESRPLSADDEEHRADDQDDREDPHSLILEAASTSTRHRFGD